MSAARAAQTLAACARVLAADPELDRVACLSADRGDAYASTIYNDGWLARNGIDPRVLDLGPVEAIAPAEAPVATAL